MTTENVPPSLVTRLTELTEKGFSKTEMAKAANVSKQAVTGWFKTGTMSKNSALSVAEAAGVSVAWLLGEEVDEENGLKPRERQMLQLFRQLPESEQNHMISMFQLRLREIDEYVEKYLRGRFKEDEK